MLDLDHEDPTQKSANVGRLLALSLPWSTVLAEIEKCSVRCANCHRRRTADAWGLAARVGRVPPSGGAAAANGRTLSRVVRSGDDAAEAGARR